MASKMIYLCNLLANMGLQQEDYPEVFEDNTVCIEWSIPVLCCRERVKHIDIHKHLAHEAVQNGHIWLYQVSVEHQLADLLTKQLKLGPFKRCLYSLLGEDPPCRDNCNYLEY
jgi:hypothetical protein